VPPPLVVEAPPVPVVPAYTPGSVAQYAKSREASSGGFVKRTSSKIASAMVRSPKRQPDAAPPAAAAQPRDPKKFEYPDPSAGPSIVSTEGQGSKGRVYETTEDGQLIIPGNWFEKMKQREFLGGMRRSEAQLRQLQLHDQLVKGLKTSTGAKNDNVIESVGTDSRTAVTYQHPKEYEDNQERLVGELAAFLATPGNVRSKLKTTKVQRAVPWQEEISANPQNLLKKTGQTLHGGVEPAFVNA
jgi:hypothetical protein